LFDIACWLMANLTRNQDVSKTKAIY